MHPSKRLKPHRDGKVGFKKEEIKQNDIACKQHSLSNANEPAFHILVIFNG
jgi:hypothetical protein